MTSELYIIRIYPNGTAKALKTEFTFELQLMEDRVNLKPKPKQVFCLRQKYVYSSQNLNKIYSLIA